ncbi:TasA family protein [Lentibacillus sediminis]|uniref:TasA family protein n=1 Tax=Lentibacillus sediminis TaxID=1940529 RepID=UPI000C1BDFED|nr:TasA family protein [Lentibacillus sediminis]
MSIKNKILCFVATAVLGLCLMGGGTYAYFSDSETAANTFAAGVLDLGLNKETIIEVDGIVPGDTVKGDFTLTNDGTVDMGEVVLASSYEVVDKHENNGDSDLGDHILVELRTKGSEEVIFEKQLSELKDNPALVLESFTAGNKSEEFSVHFTFIENNENQNHFQGDALRLFWEFTAEQREGKTTVSGK